MTPERARKIAQACADSWYGGAAGLTLKEAITQGILEACQETEGDLVATRAERDSYRQDLAAARKDNAALEAELSSARLDERHHDETMAMAADAMRSLRADLAAARALLGEARGIVHAYLRGWPNSDAGELMDRIDAALAGEKK